MSKRECETCIKKKTIYCPNSNKCLETENMPYYQNRIMLLEENQKYKEVIDRSIEYLESKRIREKVIVDIDVLEGILKEVEHEKSNN